MGCRSFAVDLFSIGVGDFCNNDVIVVEDEKQVSVVNDVNVVKFLCEA